MIVCQDVFACDSSMYIIVFDQIFRALLELTSAVELIAESFKQSQNKKNGPCHFPLLPLLKFTFVFICKAEFLN